VSSERQILKVIEATADEVAEHQNRLTIVAEKGSTPIW
jgi:DNA polymerase-3 subunit epsilon